MLRSLVRRGLGRLTAASPAEQERETGAAASPLMQYLGELLPRLRINCVLDVGAHWGEYGAQLRASGYRGRIVSFEPMRESFRHLDDRAAGDGEWRRMPYGLGDRSGGADLHLFRNGVFNSVLTHTGYGREEFGDQLDAAGTERITLRTLDEVVAECTAGIAEPRLFLKIDTQGYDQRVISGGASTVQRVIGLQTEVALSHLYADAPTFTEAIARIQALGFSPTALFPVTHEHDGVHVIEFDCVLVRKPIPE